MAKKIVLLLFFTNLVIPQDWHYPGNEVFITGQNDMQLKNIQIINRSFTNWNKQTKIRIAIDSSFHAMFDIKNVIVTLGAKKKLGKVRITLKEGGHTIIISRLSRIKPGGIITVSKIRLQNFTSFSPPTLLKVSVNDFPGRYISNIDKYSRWIQSTEPGTPLSSVIQSLRDSLFTVLDPNYYHDYYQSIINKYNRNGAFSIVDIDSYLKTSYIYLSGTTNNQLPPIEIKPVQGKNYLKKDSKIILKIPQKIKLRSHAIHVSPEKKIKGKISNNVIVLNLLKKIKNDENIIVSGLRITTAGELSPEPIKFSFRIFTEKKSRTVVSEESIGVGNLQLILQEDIQLIANADLVQTPDISLFSRSESFPLNPGDYITLLIPDSINAYWEFNQDKFSISGNGAQSIRQEPSIDNSQKKLRFTVRKKVPAKGRIIFRGLEMYAVNRSSDTLTTKSLRSPIACIIAGDYQENTLLSAKEIKIVEIKMFQNTSNAILAGDSFQELDPLTIEINCDYPAFSQNDQFRIKIPENLSMNWHLSMSKIKLSGPSANRVQRNIKFDYNYPNSIFISLRNSFNGKESFTISGLLVTDVVKTSRGNLQLFMNRDEHELTRQKNEIIIQAPTFSTQENQILFQGDSSTSLFSVNINLKHLQQYFEQGDQFSIQIPVNSPVTFDASVRRVSINDNRISKEISYTGKKEVLFRIKEDLRANSNIKITGLRYSVPNALTVTPDTLMLYIRDGNENIGPHFCENVYEIVSKKSEFKQAQYYYTLIKSNFYNKDTIKLKLSSPSLLLGLDWDEAKIKQNFGYLIPPQGGKISEPIFLNDSTIGFIVEKTLNPEDLFRLRGLYIKKPRTSRYGYLKLEYDNFYGDHQIVMNQPIEYNMEGKLGKNPRPPLFITESYTEPLMYFVDENGKRIKSNKRIKKYIQNAIDADYILPDLEIENGKLTALNKKVYSDYRSNLNYLNHSLEVKDYRKAIEIGRKLIRISPNYWKGYYKLSQALQLEGKLKTESRDNYFLAKTFGYIPNNEYPPLYRESINDQALFDIGTAKQKITELDYIEAEKILKSILQLPDTLDPKIRGNTYFLLGDIAIELNDCEYARQYYSRSSDYSVTDNTIYNFQSAREKVMDCIRLNENIVSPGLVEIAGPEGDIPETKQRLSVNFISETHYPYKINIINVNESVDEKTKLGDTLSIAKDRIYYLNYHPLREQVFNLSFAIGFIITILTMIT